MNVYKFIQKGTRWTIGNGQAIDFWNDWWCGECPLGIKFLGVHVNSRMEASGFIGVNQSWDLTFIMHLFDSKSIEIINNVHIPFYINNVDQPSWASTADGGFSTCL